MNLTSEQIERTLFEIEQLRDCPLAFGNDTKRDRLNRALTAIRQLQEAQTWRPIDDAAKDGRIVWLGAVGRMRLGFWRESENRWIDNAAAEFYAAVKSLPFEPTHYMDIPAAIQTKEQG